MQKKDFLVKMTDQIKNYAQTILKLLIT